jgi:hypothetical protein
MNFEFLSTITSAVTNNTGLIVGGGATALVAWVLKKVPNDQIANIVETAFMGLGRTCTLGLSKWKYTKDVWNKHVEPWIIDLVDNVAGGAVRGFISGLRCDDD